MRNLAPGQRFGRLTALYPTRNRHVVCRCECGAIHSVWHQHLISGRTRSCGCLNREMFKRNSRPSFCRGERNGNTKLTAEDVLEIRRLRKRGYLMREIAAEFDITKAHVSGILKGLCWTHLTN